MNLDARLTGAQAARYLGTYRQLIYTWRDRGLLTPEPDGTYRLGDILAAERSTRHRVATHGGRRRATT